MHDQPPVIYVARHGDTAWSITGQHTGLTDLPLTSQGEEHARGLRDRLKDMTFAKVLTSPLQRARSTCALAGFSSVAEIDKDLVEWDYGKYEGLRSADIHAERPDWDLFRDGAPGGETPAQVAERADKIWTRVRSITGERTDLFKRAFHPGARRPVDRAGAVLALQLVCSGHGQPQRLRVRSRSFAPGDSALE